MAVRAAGLGQFASLVSHQALKTFYRRSYYEFIKGSVKLRAHQEAILAAQIEQNEGLVASSRYGLCTGMTYQAFANRMPPTEYSDWSDAIERQRKTGNEIVCRDLRRFQPTSGSTSRRKWIPYSGAMLTAFDHAIGPWLGDLYRSCPGVKWGRHYWSLSWPSDDLRAENASMDDLTYLSWWKRPLMRATMACPSDITLARTSRGAQLASACHLAACADLTMLFVWSPTFALQLLNTISRERELICACLARGDWGALRDDLRRLAPPPRAPKAAAILRAWDGKIHADWARELWPRLAVISAWDSASSEPWAKRLMEVFPNVVLQGKGLFATEGVVTIPFQGRKVLAYRSHFYEFRDLADQRIVPSWELRQGMQVQPLLSAGNGVFRYALNDRLEVREFYRGVPCLEFLGRLQGTDLVGEKMAPETAQGVLYLLCGRISGATAVSLLAVQSGPTARPYYLALLEGAPPKKTEADRLQQQGEAYLMEHYHYRVARELGQLDPLGVHVGPEAFRRYQSLAVNKGMAEGDIKVEALTLVEQWPDREAPAGPEEQEN